RRFPGARRSVSGPIKAPAASSVPSIPSLSPAMAQMPGAPDRATASPSRNSVFRPPRPDIMAPVGSLIVKSPPCSEGSWRPHDLNTAEGRLRRRKARPILILGGFVALQRACPRPWRRISRETAIEQVGEPKVPPAAAPSHLRWDTSDLVSHDCTLATANAADGKVILSFGAKLGHNGPDGTQGGEISVNLLQSI